MTVSATQVITAMHSFMQKENLKKMVIKFTPLLESPYRITLVVPVIKILSPVFIWHPNKFNFCCPELPLAFLNLNGRKAKYLVCRMAMAILLHNSFLFPATYITTSRKYWPAHGEFKLITEKVSRKRIITGALICRLKVLSLKKVLLSNWQIWIFICC